MGECCRLGEELNKRNNILYETNNFFVVPSLGQMGIEGYLLLCSKQHFIGFGNMPKQYEPELEEVLGKTRDILSNVYNSKILVFEHGPKLGCHKGGSCLDHAHFHLVPTSINIMSFLDQKFKSENINNLSRLRDIYKKAQSSYIFIEMQDRKRYVIEVDFPIPSQYLRQIIASKLNIPNWDWRINSDIETFEKTVKNLQGGF